MINSQQFKNKITSFAAKNLSISLFRKLKNIAVFSANSGFDLFFY